MLRLAGRTAAALPLALLLCLAPLHAWSAPARHPHARAHRTTPPAAASYLPQAIHRESPVVPDALRAARGTVLVRAFVGRDGSVLKTEVKRSIPMLDEAALACVQRWSFQPAVSSGRKVAMWITVPVRFGAAADSDAGARAGRPHAGTDGAGEAAAPDPSAAPAIPPPPPGGEPMVRAIHATIARDVDPEPGAMVIVEAYVDASGRVLDARVVSASTPELEDAALAAVRQTAFPPSRHEAAAPRWIGVPVKFRR